MMTNTKIDELYPELGAKLDMDIHDVPKSIIETFCFVNGVIEDPLEIFNEKIKSKAIEERYDLLNLIKEIKVMNHLIDIHKVLRYSLPEKEKQRSDKMVASMNDLIKSAEKYYESLNSHLSGR